MQTSSAALSLDFTDPAVFAARKVRDIFEQTCQLGRARLLDIMAESYGLSSAEGRWTLRDAYDVLELGEVLHLAQASLPSAPSEVLAQLAALLAALPTRSVRSEEQFALQQLSTPGPIAYLASLAARIAPTDLVLEPSAGTGLLATFARRAGARLVLNEIDPGRAEMLQAAIPDAPVTRHDAELIHDSLAPGIRPTAVLINRVRLLKECLAAVLDVIEPGRVGLRVSPTSERKGMGDVNPGELTKAIGLLADTHEIASIHLIEAIVPGFTEVPNEPVIDTLRAAFRGSLIQNGGFRGESAARYIDSGKADAISFGRPFIANPDLVERLRHDAPLAEANFDYAYVGEGRGYTDYPTYLSV
jgi:hypothetical protein